MNRLLAIAWKEILQLRRDRLTIAMMVAIPLVQLLLFGYAINTDVRGIPLVVLDQDRSAQSRDLVRAMEVTGTYAVVGHVEDYAGVEAALRDDSAHVAVVIPPRLGAMEASGHPARVQLVVDGSDPQTVASASSTMSALVGARANDTRARVLARNGQRPDVPLLGVEPTVWYNPDLRTAVYIVPGLIGVILTMTMVMLTAMAMARERERGTLEALIVSPVRKLELIVGKILPYITIGYVQMTIILLGGGWIFDVPLVGSLALLYALAFVFIAASLAVGLLFSAMAKTQQQAMQMSFFFLLPNILLSGFMFPYEGMPLVARWLAQALPLTHFLRIVRRISLKGAGFEDVAIEVLWLAGLLLAVVVLASRRFSKQLI